MSKPWKLQIGDISLGTKLCETEPIRDPETPFRIAILSDLFASAVNRRPNVAERRTIRIDRDNINDVICRLKVHATLSPNESGQTPITIAFESIDDFHPDCLFQRMDVFAELRDLRKRIADPMTFDEAAAEAKQWLAPELESESTGEQQKPETPEPPPAISAENLLDQILEAGSSHLPTAADVPGKSDFNRFLKSIVAPHITADIEMEQEPFLEKIDAAITDLMRYVLHHPNFQKVESTWRSIAYLVSNLETDRSLQLHLLDVSKSDLEADLNVDELRRSGLYKHLVEQAIETSGGEPWSLVIGNYEFDRTADDAHLLARIAAVAQQAGAPILSAASTRVFGCRNIVNNPDPDDWKLEDADEDAKAWKELRALPQASCLGLAAPRFLLRLPYGEETDAVELFAFEEMPDEPRHGDYLWGNPAFICGYLLAQTFSRQQWNMQPGVLLEVNDLPLHVYTDDGEKTVKPCAEVLLTDRAYDAMLEQGVMPLVSVRQRDTVLLAQFLSLAEPASRLNGRWQ